MDDSTRETLLDVSTNVTNLSKDIQPSSEASGREKIIEVKCNPLQNSSKTSATTPVPSASQFTSKDVLDKTSLLTLTSGAIVSFYPQSAPTPNSLPAPSSCQMTLEKVGLNDVADSPTFLPADAGNDALFRQQAQKGLDNTQVRSEEQPVSLRNFSSYKDMQERSSTCSEMSRSGHSGINPNNVSETVNNPQNETEQSQDQLQRQNMSGFGAHSVMGGVTGVANISTLNVHFGPTKSASYIIEVHLNTILSTSAISKCVEALGSKLDTDRFMQCQKRVFFVSD